MDRELRLNSVDRYVKSSPHFVLEEHGHCEVPAGCGGVVLRWRNPLESVPVKMDMFIDGVAERQVRVDGKRPRSSRPLLPPGDHVLTINAVAGARIRLLFLVTAEPAGQEGERVQLSEWQWSVDEDNWQPMVQGAADDVDGENYTARRLLREGALPLMVDQITGPVVLRTTFHIEPERTA